MPVFDYRLIEEPNKKQSYKEEFDEAMGLLEAERRENQRLLERIEDLQQEISNLEKELAEYES
jgi:predicted  nucleic acid-binding Zn-ribbon protein